MGELTGKGSAMRALARRVIQELPPSIPSFQLPQFVQPAIWVLNVSVCSLVFTLTVLRSLGTPTSTITTSLESGWPLSLVWCLLVWGHSCISKSKESRLKSQINTNFNIAKKKKIEVILFFFFINYGV